MGDGDELQDRSALLAFVERHWRELTLSDARALRADQSDPPTLTLPAVKATLTYR